MNIPNIPGFASLRTPTFFGGMNTYASLRSVSEVLEVPSNSTSISASGEEGTFFLFLRKLESSAEQGINF